MIEQFKGTQVFNFLDRFKSDEECKAYLFELKFAAGFKCSKCSHTESYKGIKPFTKVCKQCRHTESSTSNTLFHRVKFRLRKSFAIIFDITTTAKGISALQVSRKYGIEYNTAWLFMKKARLSMASSNSLPMVGKVFVDEFVIGGYEKDKVGRATDSKKTKVIMAVEATNNDKVKRVYSMKIENYSADELGKIFHEHISKTANVHTDEWRSYMPLKAEWNITQDKKYKMCSPVNRMIQQMKSWARGTHHWISKFHTETYLNEFSFRINRSQYKESIFHKCVERMVKHEKKSRLQLSRVELMDRELFVGIINLFETMGLGNNYKVEYGKIKLVA